MRTGYQNGVIDQTRQVFGYSGRYVVDGIAVSANIRVNPSLGITAQAERAMSLIPRQYGEGLKDSPLAPRTASKPGP